MRRTASRLVPALLIAVGGMGLSACGKSGELRDTAAAAEASKKNVYEFSLVTIDGEKQSLGDYRGKVLLIVNVASKCGYTPQYEGLQKLHEQYADDGLVVLGVPSNDFFGQEPGSEAEIKAFCEGKFHVTFPMYSKVKVKGKGQHPLYTWLTDQRGSVSWNFNKFLVDREGKLVAHFGSGVEPLSLELKGAVAAELAQRPASTP